MKLLLVSALLGCLATAYAARPSPILKFPGDSSPKTDREIIHYLEYGCPQECELMVLKDTLKMQKFFLPTGDLEQNTAAIMRKPRCGVPDVAQYNFFVLGPKQEVPRAALEQTEAGQGDAAKKEPTTQGETDACTIDGEDGEFGAAEEPKDIIEAFGPTSAGKGWRGDLMIEWGRQEESEGTPFEQKDGILGHEFPGSGTGSDSHFDDDEQWTLGEAIVLKIKEGNIAGEGCKFPFAIQGIEYQSCTEGRDEGWLECATIYDFDENGKYSECPYEGLFTQGINSEGGPCKLPFIFQAENYDGCITSGRDDGYRECAITENWDNDKSYGFCPEIAASLLGNAEGGPCIIAVELLQQETESSVQDGKEGGKMCAIIKEFFDDAWGLPQEASAFLVEAHEYAHLQGLAHDPGLTATYEMAPENRIDNDDIKGIQELYAAGQDKPVPPEQGPVAEMDAANEPVQFEAVIQIAGLTFGFKQNEIFESTNFRGRQSEYMEVITYENTEPVTINARYSNILESKTEFAAQNIMQIAGLDQIAKPYQKRIEEGLITQLKGEDFSFGKSQKTYLLLGEQFWKYDEAKQRMEQGFPEKIASGNGIPEGIDSAFSQNGIDYAYAFQKAEYFNDESALKILGEIKTDWLGC
uniref:Preprogelatinase A n=1 Tax=Silurus asotus TaxID=30991 RepID=Q8AX63_SILAS|nr:preprogelatinase A [Silurus asotus]